MIDRNVIVTLMGELKGGEKFWNEDGKLLSKVSVRGSNFFSVPMAINFERSSAASVSQIKKNSKMSGNRVDSVLLFFWDSFISKSENKEKISKLKPGILVEVQGYLNKDTLLTVLRINFPSSYGNNRDDLDSDGELFM